MKFRGVEPQTADYLRMASLLYRMIVLLVAASVVTSAGAAGPRIGVLLKDRSPGFWVLAEKGALETGAALGAEVIVKAPPTVLDLAVQPRLLAALAAQELDALVVASINPDVLAPSIMELAAKGVKIVAVDTPLQEGIANVFVGADQTGMAEAAANILLSLAEDGDEVALLRNNSLDRPVLLREQTLREKVQARGGLVLHADIFASSGKDSEYDQALLLLTMYPKTKLVFASATRGTLAMVKAVREKGLVGKVKVIGFGTYLPPEAAQAIEDGIVHGWVAQEPKDIGVKAVQAAVALVKGQPVAAVVRPDFVLVTPGNFRTPAVQALRNP